jgi:hypothetical protein
MRPEGSLPACDRLAAWLSTQTSETTLPSAWTSHLGECLSCYRFWTEWRDRSQQEAQLRAILVDGAADLEGATLDLDDAFWRQLPARVYQQVAAPAAIAAATAATSHAKNARGRTPFLSRFLPAPWRASFPAWQHPFFAACTGIALGACLVLGWQSHRAGPDMGNIASRPSDEGLSANESLGDEAPGPGEGSWLGALAELEPSELAALLGSQDEGGGGSLETADEAFQELTDAWSETPEDGFGGHFGGPDDNGRISHPMRQTGRP